MGTIQKVAAFSRQLLGKDFAGRNLSVFADDSFIVSYPRSGSTWLRFMVGNLLQQRNPISFRNIERVIPDIHVNSARYIAKIPRPRILKSHEYFDPRYRKVVYLVRDPRDIAISYYRYYRKVRRFPDGYPVERYIAGFLSGNLQSWGSWGENVASWLGVRKDTDLFLLMRYEDLLEDPVAELRTVANFLGLRSTTCELEKSVELSSAKHMRELERAEGKDWATIKGSRQDVPFVGAAKAGIWRSELQADALLAIESAWGNMMEKLGYDLVSDKAYSTAANSRRIYV